LVIVAPQQTIHGARFHLVWQRLTIAGASPVQVKPECATEISTTVPDTQIGLETIISLLPAIFAAQLGIKAHFS